MGAPKRGKLLGEGCFRDVYGYGKRKVLKIERYPVCKGVYTNVQRLMDKYGGPNEREWQVWQKIKDTPLAPYFAEVCGLTEEGHLIMERASRDCYDITCGLYGEQNLIKLAAALDIFDGAEENFGVFGTTLKIIDYTMIDLRRIPSGIALVRSWAT